MSPALKEKVKQYKKDHRNLFSGTEKILVALAYPELYRELMPEKYQDRPMEAYFMELDGSQRQEIMAHCQNF